MTEDNLDLNTEEPIYTEDDNILVSETPFYTFDWYVKWIASVFILISMSIRGVEGFQLVDLTFSILGVALWTVVAFIWNDRALIVVNLVGLGFLLRTFIQLVFL
jgi:hypothetical protein